MKSIEGKMEKSSEGKHGNGTEDAEADQTKRIESFQAESQARVASARVFECKELIKATSMFHPRCLIGNGRLGHVYKGILEDGQVVVVKRFIAPSDFWAEVRMLSCVEHPNLIKMIGYCDEGREQLIVYEHMQQQSLNLHLHNRKPGNLPLDWKTRMEIAKGVADALAYLHHKKDPPVICCNLKTSGILLDKMLRPKLSDFYSARPGLTWSYTHVNTMMMLTFGYVAPEYAPCGILTSKSDIYSFGVILLELISGRHATDETITNGFEECNIVSRARRLLSNRKKLTEIADPLMRGQHPGLVQALGLAKECVHKDADKRPLASQVVTTLSSIVSQI